MGKGNRPGRQGEEIGVRYRSDNSIVRVPGDFLMVGFCNCAKFSTLELVSSLE